MVSQITPSVPLYGLIFSLTAILALYGMWQYHRRGHQQELLAFVVFMISVCLWELAAICIQVVDSQTLQHLGLNFSNAVPGILVTYSYLWLALAYSNRNRWLNQWTATLVVVHMVLTTLVLAVDPEFFYEVTGMQTQGPATILGVRFEEWLVVERRLKPSFRLLQLFAYTGFLVGTVVLGRYMLQKRDNLSTGQAAVLTVGALTPLATNSLLFFGVVPPELNPTSLSWGVTSVAFAIAIFRYRLFRIAPVGRKQLVDTMDDPVIMIDDEARIVDCNPAARELVDAPDEWLGMSAKNFFSPFSEQFNRYRDTRSLNDEITIEDSIETRHFHLDISPIQGDRELGRGSLIVLREITRLKEREKQLEQQNERLDQFASVVSHDLRNPLGIAQTYLDFARDSGGADDFDAIEEALDRMETMIDELLAMARAESILDDPDDVSLSDAAEKSWEMIEFESGTLELDLDEDATLVGDAQLLCHIFENLFRNAIEHNDSPVTITVGRLADGREGFYVEDDGDGIPESMRGTLFERGETGSDSGLGFGLPIVSTLVKAHGWEISVTDGSAGGARFEIVTGDSLSRQQTEKSNETIQ